MRRRRPIVIKFSHVVANDTPKGKAAEFFASALPSAPTARSRSRSIPTATLYKDKEELEALQLGAVQMLAPSLAKFGPLGVKEFEVFDLPFIFDNYDELHKVTKGPVGKRLLNKLEAKGITGLAYWDNGFKVMTANKPLSTPDDFKGLKMRIQSSKVLEAQMRALGALPQVMAFSEVYQALQTGVVDGTENPPSNLYTQKMHEVQKYVTLYRPRLPRLRGDHQQEVLGRPAARHPRRARAGDEGGHRRTPTRSPRKRTTRRSRRCKKSGKTQIVTLTAEERLALKKALRQGAQGDGVAHRQGDDRRDLQGDRLRTRQAVADAADAGAIRGSPRRAHSQESAMLKVLDHLEEWLIAFLMGAATLIIFVAVLHRYAAGSADSRRAGLAAQAQLQLGAGAVHLSCSSGWPSSAPPTACAPASTSASTC